LFAIGTAHAELTDDLRVYWNLNETSGTTADDSTDGFNGTASNSRIFTSNSSTSGKINSGADFSQGQDNIVSTASVSGGQIQTISMWLYATNSNSTQPFFAWSREGGSGGWNIFKCQYAGTSIDTFSCVISSSSEHIVYTSTSSLTDNAWNHIVIIYKGSNYIKFYINGSSAGSTNIAYNSANSMNQIYLGTDPQAFEQNYLGFIDEFALFRRELTTDEITELYNGGSGLTYPFTTPESVTADFNYVIDYETETITLTDSSSVVGDVNITSWLWTIDGNTLSTNKNTSFSINPNTDYNIGLFVDTNVTDLNSQVYKTISTTGSLTLNFYADNNTPLNNMYLEFDGNPYYSGSDTFITIDLTGITSGSKTILMQKTGYTQKEFNLNLNQYSDINYNMGFVPTSQTSSVNFQVFNMLGQTVPNTVFTATQNNNGYIIDILRTDALGRVTFNLSNLNSEYSFTSNDLNFGTTAWTINKPKSLTTLADINGNWKYSITGVSYSSGTNIANGVTKLLLQNTVNPYYIKFQDVAETFYPTTFGLQSITSETTKTLSPYLYPYDSASLVLIKLIDYTTNQPISEAYELDLSVYTDSNGLIKIGTFINDSTGTYNLYLDSNEQYRLGINDETYELKPTLSIYYLYMVSNIGIEDDRNVPTIDGNFISQDIPAIFGETREFFFGCPDDGSDCYPSMVFGLIVIVILSIGLVGIGMSTPLIQSVFIAVLLAGFTFIGFVPMWLFAVSLVILFLWGVYAQ
jgi:hypothetical protein